jgi:branched-chain amino acid transport system permease protein
MWTLAITNGLAFGSLLFMLAAGFSIIFGVLKVINLAHGTLYLVAAYLAISVTEAGIPILFAVAIAVIASAALAVVAERGFLQRLQGQYLTQVLVTLGFLHIFADIFHFIWGGTPMMMSVPPWLDITLPLGDFGYPLYRFSLIFIGLLVFTLLWIFQNRTRMGFQIKAAVDDEEMARASGIRVSKLRWIVFGLGGGLAGFAGAIGGPFLGAGPGLDLEVFLLALVVVVIGGVGSIGGALIAALGVGLIDSIGKIVAPELSMFLLFLPLVIVLVFKPSGLLGKEIIAPVTPQSVENRWSSNGEGDGFVVKVLLGLQRTPFLTWLSVTLLALALAPSLLTTSSISTLIWMMVWGVAAIGYNILLGYTGLPSFGHAAFFGAGAYTVGLLQNYSEFTALSSLAVAIAVSVLLSVGFGVVALRTRTVSFLLSTLALGQVLWALAFKWRTLTGGDDGLVVTRQLLFEGLFSEPHLDHYFFICVCFVFVLLLSFLLHKSTIRLRLEGVRINERRMDALGHNIFGYKLVAFVLSGAIVGLAGALFVAHSEFVSPEVMGIGVSAKIMLIAILGGAGSFWGPVIGSAVVVLAEDIVTQWGGPWDLFQGILFIAIAFYASKGIVGSINERVRKVR